MSILVNPSVITRGLVASYDVLNPKSLVSNASLKNTVSNTSHLVVTQGSINYDNTGIKNLRVGNAPSSVGIIEEAETNSFNTVIQTFSFWIKKQTSTIGVLPYFLNLSQSVTDAFITITGFGAGFTGAVCYYNGIYIGNNTFFAENILFGGDISQTWKNVTIVTTTANTYQHFKLFAQNTSTNSADYSIAQMQFYNRALSIDEVSANYFAFKGRYGL